MKLDILAFGAHPDDVELSAAGTLLKHIQLGYKCGIIDLTRGELGTRGTAETRDAEAKASSKILGLHVRECLNMEDGFFQNDKKHQLAIISVIRKYQPEIILSTAISDRHPDHSRAATLISTAVFLAGLVKIDTKNDNGENKSWKVKAHYNYIQDQFIKPDFIMNISDVWEKKMESVMAFKTQFYDPASKEPETAISSKDFLEFLTGRAVEMGRRIGVQYAEGFTTQRPIGVSNLFNIF
jgi:N-acetylglucosamine malate deacetylase 1